MRFDFDKIPVNTLVGASLDALNGVCGGGRIEPKYRGKYRLTKFVATLFSPFVWIENRIYKRKLERQELEFGGDPVFLLGHWRSGTTFVHNVLSCDKQFGFTTTYQTTFPNLMFFCQPFFKWIMSVVMPNKRPMDSLELKPDLPQEEEFAIQGLTKCNYYNFWVFPQNMLEYCEKYLLMNTISEQEQSEFNAMFDRVVRTSLWNTGGVRYLSKNPPHTGRVKELLKLYPNAKFIYLMRNPYPVYESTVGFFSQTIEPLKFQDRSEADLTADFVEVYKRLYDKYQEDKKLIPEGNLIEIKFEDFEADPLAMTEKIYKTLSLEGFEASRPAMESYVGGKRGHKKNRYDYLASTVETVETHWSRALEEWGYKLNREE